MKIEIRPIGEVVPYEKNPRKNLEAVDAVAASLKEFGFRQPIVVDTAGVIVVGHTRWMAAKKLGLKTVPVHVAGDLTPEQAKAYRIADNQTAAIATFDMDLLAVEISELGDAGFDLDVLGFDEGEMTEIMAPKANAGQADPDDVPEPPTNPITQNGDIIILGEHRLLCGDSTNAAHVERLGVKSVDCIMTDPPYCSGGFQEAGKSAGSVGTDGEHVPVINDRLSTRGFNALLKSAFSMLPASFIFAFTDWRMWVWLFDIAESSGFCVRSMIVWDKGTPGMGRGWRCQHELILWGCRNTPPFDKHASGVGNVLSEARTGNVHHTTEKPVALLSRLLGNCPFIRTIYDPFCGSGSTLIAAEQIGRKCYGIEISPAYCDVVISRWEKFTGKKAVRIPAPGSATPPAQAAAGEAPAQTAPEAPPPQAGKGGPKRGTKKTPANAAGV